MYRSFFHSINLDMRISKSGLIQHGLAVKAEGMFLFVVVVKSQGVTNVCVRKKIRVQSRQ